MKKKRFFKIKIGSFTILEALTALFIIGIAVFSLLSVYTAFIYSSGRDSVLQEASDFSNNYLTELILNGSLKTGLFDSAELARISNSSNYPILFIPVTTNIGNILQVNIYKKVLRKDPLLVNIVLEAVMQNKQEASKEKKYIVETTLSEYYLNKIK